MVFLQNKRIYPPALPEKYQDDPLRPPRGCYARYDVPEELQGCAAGGCTLKMGLNLLRNTRLLRYKRKCGKEISGMSLAVQ
jgi:hypothetical protein